MGKRFKVTSNITKKMLYEVGIELYKKDIYSAWVVLGVIISVVVLYTCGLNNKLYDGAFNIKITLFTLVSIIGVWSLKSLVGYMYTKVHYELLQTQHVFACEEYFEVKYEPSNKMAKISYLEIKKLIETEKRFFFVFDKWELWIEKDSFVEGDVDSFRDFIKERLSSDLKNSNRIHYRK